MKSIGRIAAAFCVTFVLLVIYLWDRPIGFSWSLQSKIDLKAETAFVDCARAGLDNVQGGEVRVKRFQYREPLVQFNVASIGEERDWWGSVYRDPSGPIMLSIHREIRLGWSSPTDAVAVQRYLELLSESVERSCGFASG